MSDSQRQVKMVAEQALASLVERAKRLQLSSVSTLVPGSEQQRIDVAEPAVGVAPNVVVAAVTVKGKSKASPPGAGRSFGITARKPRKLDLEPSPPPPSPRELCLIAELRDEYNQTDQLIEQMLTDATNLSQDMLYCSQHQRDLTLVQEIELETTTRSLDTLFGALSAELERNELTDIMQRCGSALARSKERMASQPANNFVASPRQQQQQQHQKQQEHCPADQFDGPTDFARIKEALAVDLMPAGEELDNYMTNECEDKSIVGEHN